MIKGKIEEVELPEKADILISEPMGMLMCEALLMSLCGDDENSMIPMKILIFSENLKNEML